MGIEGQSDHPDDFDEHREPVEPTDQSSHDLENTGYDAVHPQDADGDQSDDIDDNNIDEFIAAREKAERDVLVHTATTKALDIAAQGSTDRQPGDDAYEFWATHADDPDLAQNIQDPYTRASALATISKYTENPELAAKATETAAAIEDEDRRYEALLKVAVNLESSAPLRGLGENRELYLSQLAGITGNMDILDEIQDTYHRNEALVEIAGITGNPVAADMIDDQRTRDRAYLKIVDKTGDAGYLDKIVDKGIQDVARRRLADRPEPNLLLEYHKNYWQIVEQQNLNNLVPVDSVPQIEDPQTKLEQCIVHLKHGQYDEETRAMLAMTGLDIIRRISGSSQIDTKHTHYQRLAEAMNDPGPVYEALQDAMGDAVSGRQYLLLIRDMSMIRAIERGQR